MPGGSKSYTTSCCAVGASHLSGLQSLTKIFGDKELKDINSPCNLSLTKRMLMYSSHIKYLKGTQRSQMRLMINWYLLQLIAAVAEAVEDEGKYVVDLQQVEEETAKDEEYPLMPRARIWSHSLQGHITGCDTTRPVADHIHDL